MVLFSVIFDPVCLITSGTEWMPLPSHKTMLRFRRRKKLSGVDLRSELRELWRRKMACSQKKSMCVTSSSMFRVDTSIVSDYVSRRTVPRINGNDDSRRPKSWCDEQIDLSDSPEGVINTPITVHVKVEALSLLTLWSTSTNPTVYSIWAHRRQSTITWLYRSDQHVPTCNRKVDEMSPQRRDVLRDKHRDLPVSSLPPFNIHSRSQR